jgi:predicted SAM-dependent methyltransferase
MPIRRSVPWARGAARIALWGALAVAWAGCSGGDPAPKVTKGDAPKKVAKGEVHTCNLCGFAGPFEDFRGRPSAQCPSCKTKERHRLLLHFLEHELKLFTTKLDVLHVTPTEGEERFLRRQPNLHYVTTEYQGKGDLDLDLTALAQPDNSWDLIIVYHILEHIIEDKKAMAEMYRILRPGGRALLQVPIQPDRAEIYEDAKIVTPEERTKHFGQHDHVRWYSKQGLRERLEAVGFTVEIVDYLGKLDPKMVELHELSAEFKEPLEEHIWIATKPAAPAEPAKAEPAKAGPAKP